MLLKMQNYNNRLYLITFLMICLTLQSALLLLMPLCCSSQWLWPLQQRGGDLWIHSFYYGEQ